MVDDVETVDQDERVKRREGGGGEIEVFLVLICRTSE